ncbi:MAG: hypothetical protein RIT26_721 [Pseudomonadota bacterium]
MPVRQKVMVSLTAHESELVLIDQCLNYLRVGGVDGVVIHINANSAFNTALFIQYCTLMGAWFADRLYLNPYSVPIQIHSRDQRVVTSLHRAHIANFQYLSSCGLDFDYFALDASNSLLIRPGLNPYILDQQRNLLAQEDISDHWFWRPVVSSDANLSKEMTHIKISAHEGTCYLKETFRKILQSVMTYELTEQTSQLLGHPRLEYPREEVLFPTYFYKYFRNEPTGLNYIDLPWVRNLVWQIDEVKKHMAENFENFGPKFGIKRVAREINDPLRAFIGTVYGYRNEIVNMLRS